MAFKLRFQRKKRRGRLDAEGLVLAQAEAVRDHLSTSLLDGVSPVDGSARPRKGDGKPLGVRTGRLARKLRIGHVRKSRHRASVEIRPPRGQPADEFRESFVAEHDDILTTEGQAGRVLAQATLDYIKEQR
jgi:hypothetical protein